MRSLNNGSETHVRTLSLDLCSYSLNKAVDLFGLSDVRDLKSKFIAFESCIEHCGNVLGSIIGFEPIQTANSGAIESISDDVRRATSNKEEGRLFEHLSPTPKT